MKKSLSVILSSAMAFSVFSSIALGADSGKSSANFTDLQNLDDASKAKFDSMISAGIFDGVGENTFGLTDKMNRAQFAKVAALMFGLPVDTSLRTSSFSDVRADDPANGYALPYIEAIKKANITDGFGANSYNPAGEVTKEQLAAFLIRGLHKDAEAKSSQGVNDATVSSWAKGYAALALQLNLMANSAGGTFDGTSAATRELLVLSSYEAKQQYVPGSAAAPDAPAADFVNAGDMPSYPLNGSISAHIQGVLQEKMVNGWRFGAAVKLTNTSSSTTRIPDYELRVKASDGMVYTLQASSDNARSIAPQSSVQMNYMAEVDKNTDFDLTNVLWIDVDDEVYPKKETTLADAPVGSLVWHGADAKIDPALLGSWGAQFSIPGETSALRYSAANLTKQFTGQAPTYIVQLKVENPGQDAATVPDFTLTGKAEGSSFIGKRVEQAPVTLNAGEQKYIHYAITTEPDTELTAFYVLSAHSFLKQGAAQPVPYHTGRIGFTLPDSDDTGAALPAYRIGATIPIDPLSKAVNPETEVALQELDWFENDGQSYKTAVAKVKFTNRSDTAVPVPQLGAEIVSSQGVSYDGLQGESTITEVLPGMGAVSTYAFVVPKTENSNQFTFRLLETQGQSAAAQTAQTAQAAQAAQAQPSQQAAAQQGQPGAQAAQAQPSQQAAAQQGQPGAQAAPSQSTAQQAKPTYKTPIAQVNVAITPLNQIGNEYTFYPYKLNLYHHLILSYVTTNPISNTFDYSYKLELGLDIQTTDAVLADPSNPKILFQLEGPDGKRLGSQTYSLAGDNRLLSGSQSIMFDNAADSLQTPISIKVYEVITTPYGDARRLLQTIED
ncbi:S-layer homology domain-containing protein [Paenibacillus xerothermodurans]|uniref:S-layer homology domain-containing protein n=1 Tax=Paenibacillus xerothermodurans TaxID=1977292 RepID=UPI001A9E7F79|nr:S-layer homology domain-containing protein [Paenibacillus xerothermodurans]